MKKKISIQQNNTISDYFEDFIRVKKANGLAMKTLQTYRSHFQAISHHLDTSLNIFELNKRDFEQMISSMRDAELASNNVKTVTINHYIRHIRAYVYWCFEEYDLPPFKIKLLLLCFLLVPIFSVVFFYRSLTVFLSIEFAKTKLFTYFLGKIIVRLVIYIFSHAISSLKQILIVPSYFSSLTFSITILPTFIL